MKFLWLAFQVDILSLLLFSLSKFDMSQVSLVSKISLYQYFLPRTLPEVCCGSGSVVLPPPYDDSRTLRDGGAGADVERGDVALADHVLYLLLGNSQLQGLDRRHEVVVERVQLADGVGEARVPGRVEFVELGLAEVVANLVDLFPRGVLHVRGIEGPRSENWGGGG